VLCIQLRDGAEREYQFSYHSMAIPAEGRIGNDLSIVIETWPDGLW
jgi:hypothetical protein